MHVLLEKSYEYFIYFLFAHLYITVSMVTRRQQYHCEIETKSLNKKCKLVQYYK